MKTRKPSVPMNASYMELEILPPEGVRPPEATASTAPPASVAYAAASDAVPYAVPTPYAASAPSTAAAAVPATYAMPIASDVSMPLTVAPVRAVYAPQPIDPVQQKADSYSRVSAALIVIGLLLLGGAIAPLLTYLDVLPVAVYGIGAAYIALAAVVVMWLVGAMFAHSGRRAVFVRGTRVAALAAAEVALIILTISCYGFEFRWEATALILGALILALHVAPSRAARRKAYGLLRTNEIAVMFLLAAIMSSGSVFQAVSEWGSRTSIAGTGTVTIICYAVALAFIIAVVAVRIAELFALRRTQDAEHPAAHPLSGNPGFLVLTVLAAMAALTAFVWGCTPIYDNAYVYDVILLAGALLCVLTGFAATQPALRHTGLILGLCVVAKMVLVDTLGYDLLSKAIAFIIGGAICFGIGALYNYAVKRLVKSMQQDGKPDAEGAADEGAAS